MRKVFWETSTGALAALLNARGPLTKADAWTITLRSGQVLRWSGADVALALGARTFTLGPGIRRSRCRWTVGVAVDTLTVQLADNAATLINGQPLAAFLRARGFDGAQVQLERVFWGTSGGPVGSLLWFLGFVDDCEGDRWEATMRCSSYTKLLDVQVPRGVYQSQCANTLFDSACGLAQSGYVVSSSAAGATNTFRNEFAHSLPQAAGYFSLGRVTMTSGANAGVSRTIKQHTAGVLRVLQPWPFAVASGDTFDAIPGCDKALSTCEAKFSNRTRFRGQPFVPAAETVL
jgi:uncharacterized phage protein (TIGR02218 family)